MHGLIAGLEYTVTCRGKAPAVTAIANYKVRISEFYSGAWHDSDIAMTEVNAWELFTLNLTLNAATTGIRFSPRVLTNEAVNSLFYVDNVRLQPIGVHNEFSQQFSDAGARTLLGVNSWQ